MISFISCDFCGVVLDADKIAWPADVHCIDSRTYEYVDAFTAYDDDGFYKKTHCPVCENRILDKRRRL
jgi:hypothetical protein